MNLYAFTPDGETLVAVALDPTQDTINLMAKELPGHVFVWGHDAGEARTSALWLAQTIKEVRLVTQTKAEWN